MIPGDNVAEDKAVTGQDPGEGIAPTAPSESGQLPSSRREGSLSQMSQESSAFYQISPAFACFLLLAVGLPFGAVHTIPYALAVATAAVLGLWALRNGVKFTPRMVAYLTGLAVVASYAVIQSLLIRVGSENPISPQFSRSTFYEFLEHYLPGLVLFLGVFLVGSKIRMVASERKKRNSTAVGLTSHFSSTLERDMVLVGLCFSLIALSHWLADSGKLFWIFSPIYDAGSNRARWPFVNPNHLGFFLLPFCFLSLSATAKRFLGVFELSFKLRQRKQSKEQVAELLSRQDVQREIGSLGLSLLVTLTIFICVIATLSRACWTGLLLATLILIPIYYSIFHSFEDKLRALYGGRRRRRKKDDGEPLQESAEGSYSTPSSDTRYVSGKTSLSFALACVLSCLALFLGLSLLGAGEGREYIENRFLYGLVSSQENMRWQMFIDSLQMVSPLGIGIGRWNEAYQGILSEGMAGVHPRYLHSEPLQTLIEMGVVGFLLTALLYLYPLLLLVRSLLSLLKRNDAVYSDELRSLLYSQLFVSALIASWIAITFAFCLDFPLRIPANLAMVALLSAISIRTVERIDARKENS